MSNKTQLDNRSQKWQAVHVMIVPRGNKFRFFWRLTRVWICRVQTPKQNADRQSDWKHEAGKCKVANGRENFAFSLLDEFVKSGDGRHVEVQKLQQHVDKCQELESSSVTFVTRQLYLGQIVCYSNQMYEETEVVK